MSGSDPFVAEIALFPFSFAPRGWAWCDGQLLPISQNTALFSLLGTTYGGDGRSTFALPNLNGRAPLHHGQGPGLTWRDLGEGSGDEAITLNAYEIPSHSHALAVSPSPARTANPATAVPASSELDLYHVAAGSTSAATGIEGGGQPHNNMQPYLTLYYAIALQGIFPPRS